MKIKSGVILNGLNINMRKVLILADKLWAENGQELVITAGLDGAHSPGSLHYYGLALDLRTRYFDLRTQEIIAQRLSDGLGDDYDVVLHRSHIHVEYDPK